jgi:hypothetical protein
MNPETMTYKIVGNRCVFSFHEPNEIFCRALADSKLFGGITITQSFTQASFYAKNVCSLRELLSQRREKLQYIEGVKMAQCIGQQLFYLEKYAHTFSWFNIDNILVVDESSFLCIGLEQLMPVDAFGRIWFTTPFSNKQPHIAPEIKRLYILPSYVTYQAAYYSLGSLITFFLAEDDEKSTKMQLRLEFIADTKLYWFLLRSIDPEPGARLLLFV